MNTLLIVAAVFAYINIPDTPSVSDKFLGRDVTNRYPVTHIYTGATAQDSLIATNAAADLYTYPFDMQRHLRTLYGDMWRRQAKRALVERCSRLIEDPKGVIALCDYDPRNLICRPTDCPLESYEQWSCRNQKLWYIEKHNVPRNELFKYYRDIEGYFVIHRTFNDTFDVCRYVVSEATSKSGTSRGWFAKESGMKYYLFIDKDELTMRSALNYLLDPKRRINPIYHEQIKGYFDLDNFKYAKENNWKYGTWNPHSFCIPLYGSYVFKNDAFFEEFSHQMNVAKLRCDWSVRYDVAATNFPSTFQSVTKWSEFVVGMAGAKQNAFERGFDIGAEGGFEDFFESVERLVVQGVNAMTDGNVPNGSYAKEVASCTLRLLGAYKWAKGNPQSEDEAGHLQRFISWCESAAVGRMVL